MKTFRSSIIQVVLLMALLLNGTAIADDLEIFKSVRSDGTLEAPKLAVTVSGKNVSLSWTQVDGANDYVVYYAQYPYDNPDTIKAIDVGDKTSASYELSPGEAYLVAAKACKNSSSECSDYSTVHKVVIPLDTTYTNSLGQTFVLLPAGTFTMGSPSDELGRNSDETQHQVTLTKAFYMQITEVTQAQWKEVTKFNLSYFGGCPTCPVDSVSWGMVQMYIAALNARGEGTYRLPTEAEWEYAARAGSTTAFSNGGITGTGCGYDPILNAMGWYCYNAADQTHPVAQKSPNAWGLYDMSGNVYEWCQDWYGPYSSGAVSDPTGPSLGSARVLRGGGWYGYAWRCRSAYRGKNDPAGSYYRFGFRLVRQP